MLQDRPLDGKVAVITGGGSGIGQATAQTLAAAGATVAVVDQNLAAAQAVVNALPVTGGAWQADVTQQTHLTTVAEEINRRFGRLDILVTAAGIFQDGRILEIDEAHWDRVFNVNVKGTFLTIQACLPAMLAQKSGAIVTLGSFVGMHPARANTAYGPSKAAVSMLTKVVALDYGPLGIRANCLCPGVIWTPLFAQSLAHEPDQTHVLQEIADGTVLGRMGTVDEVAQTILFLVSEAAAYITGTDISIDGGRGIKRR